MTNTTTTRKANRYSARAVERLISMLVHRAMYLPGGMYATEESRRLLDRCVAWRVWQAVAIFGAESAK